MSSIEHTFHSVPLVQTGPGTPLHDLVGVERDEASDEMSRSIWLDFRKDLLPRLEALQEGNVEAGTLSKELHSLRGLSSQFGLFLLEILLFAWEKKEADPVGATRTYLPGSLEIARLSLHAIEADFPHLKESTG